MSAFKVMSESMAQSLADDIIVPGNLREYFRQLFLHFHESGKKNDIIALCASLYPDIHAQYLIDVALEV